MVHRHVEYLTKSSSTKVKITDLAENGPAGDGDQAAIDVDSNVLPRLLEMNACDKPVRCIGRSVQ